MQMKTALVVFLLTQSACFFSGGASTFKKTTSASGSGFLSVTERNGQWDTGSPPRVGDVTDRTIYRKMEKTTAVSIGYFGKIYELSDPYPPRRSRIAAIREVGTDSESGGTVHYYQVEFDPETGN